MRTWRANKLFIRRNLIFVKSINWSFNDGYVIFRYLFSDFDFEWLDLRIAGRKNIQLSEKEIMKKNILANYRIISEYTE